MKYVTFAFLTGSFLNAFSGMGVALAAADHQGTTPSAAGTVVEAKLPPTKCGALVPCAGHAKTFMYSCTTTEVTIRLCLDNGSESAASRGGDDDAATCVGPKRKLSRDEFFKYFRAELDKIAANGGDLGPLTTADVAAAKSDGSAGKHATECNQLQTQIAAKKAQRAQLASGLPANHESLTKIDEEIQKLEATLSKENVQAGLCKNKQSAVAAIDGLINDAIQSTCGKGMRVPPVDSFIYKVLSQKDPSQHPCGYLKGQSLAQRMKECGEQPKLLSNGQTFTVIARKVDKNGTVSEYHKDDATDPAMIWGPEAAKIMTYEHARRYCEKLTDLGLKWHVPTRTEFMKAGNKNNADTQFGFNKVLPEVLSMQNKWFISATGMNRNLPKHDAHDLDPFILATDTIENMRNSGMWIFQSASGQGTGIDSMYPGSVRCVAQAQ